MDFLVGNMRASVGQLGVGCHVMEKALLDFDDHQGHFPFCCWYNKCTDKPEAVCPGTRVFLCQHLGVKWVLTEVGWGLMQKACYEGHSPRPQAAELSTGDLQRTSTTPPWVSLPEAGGEGSPFSWQIVLIIHNITGLLVSLQQEWKNTHTQKDQAGHESEWCGQVWDPVTQNWSVGTRWKRVLCPTRGWLHLPRWQLVLECRPSIARASQIRRMPDIFCLFIFGCAGSSLHRTGFSLVVASRGLLFAEMCRLLIVVASFIAEHGCVGFSSCDSWA